MRTNSACMMPHKCGPLGVPCSIRYPARIWVAKWENPDLRQLLCQLELDVVGTAK